MTRLYFASSLQAAYMAQEFGVKIDVENDKFYVAKESEHIFEPKEGDSDCEGFIFGEYFTINHMTGKKENIEKNIWSLNLSDESVSKNNSEIFMRDNKHFFAALKKKK